MYILSKMANVNQSARRVELYNWREKNDSDL